MMSWTVPRSLANTQVRAWVGGWVGQPIYGLCLVPTRPLAPVEDLKLINKEFYLNELKGSQSR